MLDLHQEADRHADMIRPHVEATGGVESFFIAERTGQPPLALPATFETVEAKEDGLALLRAVFQDLGCTQVAWISEAWVAVTPPGGSDLPPRDRPDRTEALMIVVEDAAGLQAVRIDPFSKLEGRVSWGETIRSAQAERFLLSGPVKPGLREQARAIADTYRPQPSVEAAPSWRQRLGRVFGRRSG